MAMDKDCTESGTLSRLDIGKSPRCLGGSSRRDESTGVSLLLRDPAVWRKDSLAGMARLTL
jgi:hypothetical protein